MKTKEEKQLFLKKLIPFSLTVLVILADQITKILVVKNIPPYTVLWSFWDGLLRIIHVRNLGVAFSMGYSWPVFLRKLDRVFTPARPSALAPTQEKEYH